MFVYNHNNIYYDNNNSRNSTFAIIMMIFNVVACSVFIFTLSAMLYTLFLNISYIFDIIFMLITSQHKKKYTCRYFF